jgi:competence protein ComEC
MAERTGQSFRRRCLAWGYRSGQRLESLLEADRDQIMPWVAVAMGVGIALWYHNDGGLGGLLALLLAATLAFLAYCYGPRARMTALLFWALLAIAMGYASIMVRSASVAAPVLESPRVLDFYAVIRAREDIPARQMTRLTLATQRRQELPAIVRVNMSIDVASAELRPGAVIALRARLMPPAGAALPGAYDFARRAWFMQLGATGSVLGPVRVVTPANNAAGMQALRRDMAQIIREQMPGSAGAIGATLATGDRGAISEADAEAMRRSGLAHLLSISGLHVTAMVGAAYILLLKLLALVPPLALRLRLPIIAACGGALAAVSYTLFTGAEVPTIRACIAALVVLAGLALGRDAITMRVITCGAIIVMVFWPETVLGPSFQLSFAAVTAIVALHEHRWTKARFSRREEGMWPRLGRGITALFLTGLVVELALLPIALFHFHKAGLYGALANIIAIPLTTFVIMPSLALALLLENIGIGWPLWWLCGMATEALVALAHFVSAQPFAVTLLPTMPDALFGTLVLAGLWLALWQQPWRYWALPFLIIGGAIAVQQRAPDIFVLSDGKHMALRTEANQLALLRTRSGEFTRAMLMENSAVSAEPLAIEDWPGSKCSPDSCIISLRRGGRDWTILATRSRYYLDALEMAATCRRVDIVISERGLPKSCKPTWLKIDRRFLRDHGGVTIDLIQRRIITVRQQVGTHPWTGFDQQKLDQRPL